MAMSNARITSKIARTPSRTPKRRDAVRTRETLLAAAAEAFARHGYRDTPVRKICAEAKVNLGAVSHYFGSKEALYREVLVMAHRQLVDAEPVPEMSPGDDPRAALRNWVRYALRLFLLRRAAHPHARRLFAWELRDPTPALDELIALVMLPVRQALERIVAALLGDADEPRLRGQCANFVGAVCIMHEQGQEIVRRFGHPVPHNESGVDLLADRITEFAVGGIERIRDGGNGSF
ncbi:MAG: CerR family C-terminal domain-containing protein [Planctomycetaceae bacterium]|nr:CerR family C-terminal domain-containing protein [Planctomycetaceae bacterium]